MKRKRVEKTEKELLKEISEKLDKLIAMSAIQGKSEEKQGKILKSLGFTYSEISNLTGIPEGTLKTRDRKEKTKKDVKK